MPKAKEIMTTEVVTIDGSATAGDAMKMMKAENVRSLIVDRRDENDAYGMITQRDIVYNVVSTGLDPESVKVHEIMSKPLVVVNPDLDMKYVARLMANTGLSRAPVIGDHKLMGVVTLSDIVANSV